MGFTFKERSSDIKFVIKKEKADGTFDEKVLSLNCSATNYKFIKRASEAGKKISAVLKKGLSVESLDEMISAEREAFEILAPGQWDDVFDFLGNDAEYMAQLAAAMLETVRSKGAESKAADVAPVVPDGESV